jgi:putative cell wall-binding protein
VRTTLRSALGCVVVGAIFTVTVGSMGASPASSASADVGRIAGVDRFATAVAISRRAFPNGAAVAYVARSDSFADALAAGALRDGPLLLVPTIGDVPHIVTDEIERLDPNEVIAVGGTNAVHDDTLADAASGRPTSRLAGASRFETAVEVAQRAFPDAPEVVYVARADAFADALAGGVLTDGPVLLVPTTGPAPTAVREYVSAVDPARVLALGGSGAVSASTLDDAAGGRATARLAGDNRYTTAVAVAEHAFSEGSSVAYAARADSFADALAGGTLDDGPILLVPRHGPVPESVIAAIPNFGGEVQLLGGTGAISEQVEADLSLGRSDRHFVVGIEGDCARMASGHVRCWNLYGVDPDITPERDWPGICPATGCPDSFTVYEIENLDNVIDLSGHCALRIDGVVLCIGGPWDGTGGPRHESIPPPGEARPVPGVTNTISLADGGAMRFVEGCALIRGGEVRCWGYDNFGQRGDDATQTPSALPVEGKPVVGVTNAIQVVNGDSHRCALLAGGAVTCWGFNFYGERGDGNSQTGGYEPRPALISGVSRLAADSTLTCASFPDRSVSCFGNLKPFGGAEQTPRPTPVPGLSGAGRFALTCAHFGGADVRCGFEQAPSPQLTRIDGLPEAADLYAMRFGYRMCAAGIDGRVLCWDRTNKTPRPLATFESQAN